MYPSILFFFFFNLRIKGGLLNSQISPSAFEIEKLTLGSHVMLKENKNKNSRQADRMVPYLVSTPVSS